MRRRDEISLVMLAFDIELREREAEFIRSRLRATLLGNDKIATPFSRSMELGLH
jgi:uncharacterized ubiquitin-like protein YukD